MARPPTANSILRNFKKQPYAPSTPIATNMHLPNHSGDHSAGSMRRAPVNNTDLVNKEYVDDTIGALDLQDVTDVDNNTTNELIVEDSVAGILRNRVHNTSTASVSVIGAGYELKNDNDYWGLLAMTNSGATIGSSGFTNTMHLYNQGYGNTLLTTDGNKDFVFYADPTDSHNFSALNSSIMTLKASGELQMTNKITNVTDPTANQDAATKKYVDTLTKAWDFTILDPNGAYDVDTQIFIGWARDDLTITKIQVELDSATNQVAGDLKYADDFLSLANAAVINDFDTTSGKRTDTSISSASVASGKAIYLQFDSQPHEDINQMHVHIEWEF